MDLTHDVHECPVVFFFAVLTHLKEHLAGRYLVCGKHITSTAQTEETCGTATWVRLLDEADLACLLVPQIVQHLVSRRDHLSVQDFPLAHFVMEDVEAKASLVDVDGAPDHQATRFHRNMLIWAEGIQRRFQAFDMAEIFVLDQFIRELVFTLFNHPFIHFVVEQHQAVFDVRNLHF